MAVDSRSYTSCDIFEPLDLVGKLQAFESVAGGRDSPDGLHSMVDLYAYLTSLLMNEDSIERLDLNVDANLSLKELLKPAGEDSVFASPVECTLKLFDKLKHLALGAHTLYYYTSETSKDQAEISRSLMVYRRI
jgi:hypothetical protein